MNLVGQFHWTGNHIDISDLAKLVKESCSACSTKTQKGETILSESQIEQWNNEIVGDWVHEESSEKTSYGNTPGGKSPSEKNAIRSIRLYQLFMSFSPNGEATGKHYVHKVIVNNGEKTVEKADSALFRGLWRLAHNTLFVDGQDSIVWPGSLILGKTPTYQKRFIIQKIEEDVIYYYDQEAPNNIDVYFTRKPILESSFK